MKSNGFSMIELVVVIIVVSILATGTTIALSELYNRSMKSKAISELSYDSQLLIEQISQLLSARVPSTVIGYDMTNDSFEPIYNMNHEYKILEWIGRSIESFNLKEYSSFIDLEKSDRNSKSLYSPDSNFSKLSNSIKDKFEISSSNIYHDEIVALIFSGSYDEGSFIYSNEFNNSFGWHENSNNYIYEINSIDENNITLKRKPSTIYEKYFLIDSAYAIARGKDIDISANCIQDLNVSVDENSLFLFFNYRPWRGESFCADLNAPFTEGNVTILSTEVSGFEIDFANGNLIFNVTLKRFIPKRAKKNSITISKQKVVY